MSDHYPVLTDIILDGKVYGMRTWHHVPRVGDEVAVRKGPDMAMSTVIVRRVVWLEPDERIYDCRALVYCETVG